MSDFTFYTTKNTNGEAKEILESIDKQYGFVPNLFAYMAEAPYTIEAYSMLTDLLSKTGLSAAHQQVALLAVSQYNQCEFCKVAHQAFGKMAKANPQTLSAIINDTPIEEIEDKVLVDTIISIVDNRGWISDDMLQSFFDAGFEKRNVYDLILIVTIKTLSNYANHLTRPEPNQQLLDML